ncbi:MAG: endonuclease domain-containing protein [Patescibacteria group bacterium]
MKHLPYDPDLVELAQKMRKNMTPQERKLWYEFLRYRKPPFYRQRPIYYYIVDFYHPASKLVIEIDGAYHQNFEQHGYDTERDAELISFGLTVMRFTNTEIDNDLDSVCSKILTHCEAPFG